MTTPELILPESRRASIGDYRASYIKHWRNQLKGLLATANLTGEQQKNMSALVERETKLVFVDQKCSPEKRLDFWRNRQLSPFLLQARANQAIYDERLRLEVVSEATNLIRSLTPPGYEPTSEDRQALNFEMSKLRTISDMASFSIWARQVFKPTMVRNQAARIAEAQALEDSRKRSIKASLPDPKF